MTYDPLKDPTVYADPSGFDVAKITEPPEPEIMDLTSSLMKTERLKCKTLRLCHAGVEVNRAQEALIAAQMQRVSIAMKYAMEMMIADQVVYRAELDVANANILFGLEKANG